GHLLRYPDERSGRSVDNRRVWRTAEHALADFESLHALAEGHDPSDVAVAGAVGKDDGRSAFGQEPRPLRPRADYRYTGLNAHFPGVQRSQIRRAKFHGTRLRAHHFKLLHVRRPLLFARTIQTGRLDVNRPLSALH